ncbi:hypothetical protein Fmac_006082 [Flemingia macrophylla]|uniref:Uncharacterized protein n=1 Tax=Flemingia macrophylla TaxID=520843 RepID=A0ABD1N9K4_9FABA
MVTCWWESNHGMGSHGYIGALHICYSLRPFSIFMMATTTTTGAHTSHAQPNFVSDAIYFVFEPQDM